MAKKPAKEANGSVLSRAIPVADLEDDFIKMVLYGVNRIGKTTLACQFPKPLLLVTFEPAKSGGAKSVRKVPYVDFIQIGSTVEAEQLAQELETSNKYKSHILDGGSNWERMHLSDVLGISPEELTEQIGKAAHGGITREHYTERTERIKNQLRKFLRLSANTVLVCTEKDHSPPRDQFQSKVTRGFEPESFFAANLSGGAVGWLHDACDYIARLYIEKETKEVVTTHKIGGKAIQRKETVETGNIVRKLRTLMHPNYAAGFRSENPIAVPECITRPTYEKIAKVVRGELLPGEKYPSAEELADLFN